MSEIEFMDVFGDNLRDLLEEVGVSQNQLAKKIGVSSGCISYYINKQRIPSLTTFLNVCIALECDPDNLVPMYDYIY